MKIIEQFKTILYRGVLITVSNHGTVIIDGKTKRHNINHDGYPVISLRLPNGQWRCPAVHRLVALAFVPNPHNLPEVNHKDYNRMNPDASNLEWITHADNVRYSNCNKPDVNGENNPNFGNKTLSQKYNNNKKLAKEKQGRPGTQNGRCVKIEMYYDDCFVQEFDYIKECCQYFIDNNLSQAKNPESVRSQINGCIRKGTKYLGHYTFKKLI